MPTPTRHIMSVYTTMGVIMIDITPSTPQPTGKPDWQTRAEQLTMVSPSRRLVLTDMDGKAWYIRGGDIIGVTVSRTPQRNKVEFIKHD